MNGVGLSTVGQLLGHRQRGATAIYAHLDDGALRDVAALAAAVIARAMGYRAEPLPLPDEAERRDASPAMPEFSSPRRQTAPEGKRTPLWPKTRESVGSEDTESVRDAGSTPERADLDWL